MKNRLLIIPLLCLALSIRAQTLERSVLSAAGKTETAKSITLDWTLGELAVSRLTHPEGIIQEGFHQPFIVVEHPDQPITADSRFQVFPNPSDAVLFVQAGLDPGERVLIRLFDATGKSLLPDRLAEGPLDEELNLQPFPTGVYHLVVTDGGGKMVYSARVVKR